MKKFLIILISLISIISCSKPTIEEQAKVVLDGERERLPLVEQNLYDGDYKIQIDTITIVGINDAYLTVLFKEIGTGKTKEILVAINDIKLEKQNLNGFEVSWNSNWPYDFQIYDLF